MPNWKKLITSGSNASLASLNVTNAITGSALTISGNSTVSNLTSSGTISGSRLVLPVGTDLWAT